MSSHRLTCLDTNLSSLYLPFLSTNVFQNTHWLQYTFGTKFSNLFCSCYLVFLQRHFMYITFSVLYFQNSYIYVLRSEIISYILASLPFETKRTVIQSVCYLQCDKLFESYTILMHSSCDCNMNLC